MVGYCQTKERSNNAVNGKVISAVISIVIAVLFAIGALIIMENYEGVYYTRVDNSEVKELSSNSDMKYEYSLSCYSEGGQEKILTFKTLKKLREDAFLKLEVRSLGVHNWEEVQYSELPQKVQEKYDVNS